MDNLEIYIQEQEEFAGFILKKNRHNCLTGEWYGPEQEPTPAGPNCKCAGCGVGLTVWDL